jgi:hypothetical protein
MFRLTPWLQPGGRPAQKSNETVLTVYCMYQAVETATTAGRLQPHRAEATVLIRTTTEVFQDVLWAYYAKANPCPHRR